jgi:malate synthase
VFHHAQRAVGLPAGTVRATVLIETLPAAFEADEILWELRQHSAGLNCGRWDYIFSCIKTLRAGPDRVFPDRASVTMDRPFLSAYTGHVIRTCHRRRAHALGGMAAQIPIRDNPEANERAIDKVRADKQREVRAGHDGTWVAHPGLVGVASEAFGSLTTCHQIHVRRDDARVTAQDLLTVPLGPITEAGLRTNVRVGLHYLESWLRGVGCVPINHLMEDAATAEISRSQVWQWVKHGASLADGRVVSADLVAMTVREELERQIVAAGVEDCADRRFTLAARLLEDMMTGETLEDFLTVAAYDHLE